MATAQTIIDEALRLANRANDVSYRGRALNALNRAHRYYARRYPWSGLRREEVFLTNGTRFLVLPERVMQIITIGDKTNSRQVEAGDHWGTRSAGPHFQDTAGAVLEWRPVGMVPVIAQPSTDSRLLLQTTVSDGVTVRLRGLSRDTAASGTALALYPVVESLVMNGTGQTQTENIFVEVHSIEKDRDALADLLVSVSVSGARIARIPSWSDRSLLNRVQFLFSPEAGLQLRVEYYIDPGDVTDESHALDSSIDVEFLTWRALGDLEFMLEHQEAAQLAWNRAEDLLSKKQLQEETFGDFQLTPHPWRPGYFNMEEPGGSYF